MGLAKRRLEEIESRGAKFIGSMYVCAQCLEDETLQAYAQENADATSCDYCENQQASVLVDDLVDVIMQGILTEYDDPNNILGWDSAEGGWVGQTIDKWELVGDLGVTESSALYEDIVSAIIVDEWCERDAYVLPEHERLAYGWRKFCETVKHETRFYYSRPKEQETGYKDPDEMSPNELLRWLEGAFEELGLLTILPAGTPLVRARAHDAGDVYTTVEQLGPSPRTKAAANRMSSPGIPMFYGALETKTALEEINYPDNGRAATVATFLTTREMNVVDLTRVPGVPSIFDADNAHLRPMIRFVHDFMTDFSKPISEDDAPIEYVPTQIVTEHIRHAMSGDMKGVIYPSSRVSGKSCVLFVTNEECRENDSDYPVFERYLQFVPTSVREFQPVA